MGSLQMNNKYKLFFAVSNASNDAFMVTTEMPKLKNCLACDISYGSRGRSRTFKMTKGWGGGGREGRRSAEISYSKESNKNGGGERGHRLETPLFDLILKS